MTAALTTPPADAAPTPRRRPALSPSRAGDFKQCPLLYRFRVVDRLPETSSPAQVRGTVVHAVLERLFALPAAQRLPARARELAGAVVSELDPAALACLIGAAPPHPPADDPQVPLPRRGDAPPVAPEARVPSVSTPATVDPATVVPATVVPVASDPATVVPVTPSAVTPAAPDPGPALARIATLLDAYFRMEDPTRLEPEACELYLETEIESGVLLRGYVDRLDVAPTGEIRVVDYKTGSAPRELFEAKALFQMKFYALVLLRTRGVLPRQLRLMYLADGETLTYSPDVDELGRFERTLDALWSAVLRAAPTGDFRPNPGRLCRWCDHQALCPAFGGTPPDYPGWPTDTALDEVLEASGAQTPEDRAE